MDLQHTLRSIIRGMPRILFGGVPVERAGDERLALHKLGVRPGTTPLRLLAPAFAPGQPIPPEHSTDGEGVPPILRWAGVPQAARSLVLLVEDPDAPTPNPYVHWMLYGMAAKNTDVQQALTGGARTGRNSALRTAWAPIAPPRGDTPHRYVFQLFALDRDPGLNPGVGRSALLEAMHRRVVACATLEGTYQRAA